MTEEREKEEAKKIMEMLGPDGVLRECIHQTSKEILETKVPLIIGDMFEEELGKVLKDALGKSEENIQNPVPKISMLLEGLIKASARVIVMMSSINPLLLGRSLDLPGDQVDLLRRGVEDHFADLAGHLLKQRILNSHQDFTEFYKEIK